MTPLVVNVCMACHDRPPLDDGAVLCEPCSGEGYVVVVHPPARTSAEIDDALKADVPETLQASPYLVAPFWIRASVPFVAISIASSAIADAYGARAPGMLAAAGLGCLAYFMVEMAMGFCVGFWYRRRGRA